MKSIITSILFLGLAFTANAQDDKKETVKKADYPLTTCVISGEKLGDHGKPYVFEHDGTEVQLCCKACLKDFKKDAEQHIKTIREAAGKKDDSEPKKE